MVFPLAQEPYFNIVWLGFCLYFVMGRHFVARTLFVRNLVILVDWTILLSTMQ